MAVLQRYASADGTGSIPRVSTPTRTSTPDATPRARGSATGTGRVAWIDASRALAVVLVVLFHVTIGHYYLMEWADGQLIARWDRTNQILSVIRMPLLFALSGMLASGKIRRGFRGGTAIEGAVTNYYLYVVWLFAYGGFVLLLPGDYPAPHKVESADLWVNQLWAPNTYLWYVFALAVYIVAFTALRRVPAAVMLGGLFVLHVVTSELWTVESALWTRALTYALFFGLGVYGGRVLRYLAASPLATTASGIASYVVYQQIGMTKLMSTVPSDPVDATWLVILYVLMGMTAVGVVGCLTRVPLYAAIGTFLGRHTLGIYVLHIPVATVFNLLLLGPLAGVGAYVVAHPDVQLLYPALAGAVVVLACIGAECALKATRYTRWMFEMPEQMRSGCDNARSALHSHERAPRLS